MTRYVVFLDTHCIDSRPWQLRDQKITTVIKSYETEAEATRHANALNTAGYHWRDGLDFRRGPEACVEIVRAGTDTTSGELIASIPANEWASIVSYVSKGGETGESYSGTLAFHTGSLPYPSPGRLVPQHGSGPDNQ